MKNILMILIILTFISCDKKEEIQLYFLKERKENKQGLKPSELIEYSKKNGYAFKNYGKHTTIDTINKKVIFAGDFNYSIEDLEKEAFLFDKDFLNLDTINNVIELSNFGGRKILDEKINLRNGKQFVITVNGKPYINGYLWNAYSSNGTDWYTIQYDNFETIKDINLKSYKFSFYKGMGTSDKSKREKIPFKEYPNLLQVLEESNRLKKK